MGKIAVFSALAALAAAVGMALPGAQNPVAQDAEAQGAAQVRHGYTYTRMICQEWGQQPRWYHVRDPIPGSDWRNDGGWAIILEGGSGGSTRDVTTFIRGSSPFRTWTAWSTTHNYGITGEVIVDNSAGSRSKETLQAAGGQPSWVQLGTYEQGEFDGHHGYRTTGTTLRLATIDANKDGAITAADAVFGQGENMIMFLWYGTTQEVTSGGSYIRWADLRWCR